MPIHEFTCPNNHSQEVFFKSILDKKPEFITCAVCKLPAERIISISSVAFQPYSFAAHSFATHGDRISWLKNHDLTDFGGAHRELKEKGKDVGSRSWEERKGTKIEPKKREKKA